MLHACVSSPGAPVGDAHALDDVDAKLADVDEEEDKEAEGAVAPAQGEGGEKADAVSRRLTLKLFSRARRRAGHVSPERSVEWPVPADERARREEQEPEDGEAEVHAPAGVHAEPGQAAHQVGQQRPSVNCEGGDVQSLTNV